jgi:hypothetical protein
VDPVELIQRQVDAYVRRDVEAFSSCYASDAVIRDGEGNVLISGHDQMRDQYGSFFRNNPDLTVAVLNRMHVDSWVVDCEHIRYAGNDLHAIVGYQVQGGLIQSVVIMADGYRRPSSR